MVEVDVGLNSYSARRTNLEILGSNPASVRPFIATVLFGNFFTFGVFCSTFFTLFELCHMHSKIRHARVGSVFESWV